MSDQLNEFDAASIDRLVDGELSPEERRRLLATLEAQPDGWRQCALAFLEAQAWRSEMRQLVGAGGDARAQVSPCAPVQSAAVQPVERRGNGLGRLQGGLWLAVAAALLIAFGLGRESEMVKSIPSPHEQLAADAGSRQQPGEDQAAASGDAVTLVVNDHRGVPQRVRVPLVEGRNLGDEFAEAPQWASSPELMRKLNEQGIGLAARRRYAPMYFEQQNQIVPMIVPVDDAVVTPVSRPVY